VEITTDENKIKRQDGTGVCCTFLAWRGDGRRVQWEVLVLVRGSRAATCPATGLCRIFALHSTGLALTKKEGNQSDCRNQKRMEWRGDERRKNSLARPIRAAFRRLPASDLTLPAEVTCQADCLPSLLGLLGLFVVGAAGNPWTADFPFREEGL
jgi:hypothetical protein